MIKVSEAACAVMFAVVMCAPEQAKVVVGVWSLVYVLARGLERACQEGL